MVAFAVHTVWSYTMPAGSKVLSARTSRTARHVSPTLTTSTILYSKVASSVSGSRFPNVNVACGNTMPPPASTVVRTPRHSPRLTRVTPSPWGNGALGLSVQAITWNIPDLRGFSPVASVYVFVPLGVHFTSVVSYSFTNVAVSFPMVCGSAYFTPSSPASFVILDFTVSVPSWLSSVTVTTTSYNA